eukprot:UN30043
MTKQWNIELDEVAYAVMIDSCATEDVVRGKKLVKEAFEVKEFRGLRLYNAAIHLASRMDNYAEAFRIFGEMRRHNISPDAHTFIRLFRVCARTKHGEKLEKLSRLIEDFYININPNLMLAWVDAYARNEQISEAADLIMSMPRKGIKLNSDTHDSLIITVLIGMAELKEDSATVMDFLESVHNLQIKPKNILAGMMKCFAANGDIELARSVFQQAEKD